MASGATPFGVRRQTGAATALLKELKLQPVALANSPHYVTSELLRLLKRRPANAATTQAPQISAYHYLLASARSTASLS